MKTKTSLSGFVLGIFAVLFLMSFVSADTLAEWSLTSSASSTSSDSGVTASALTIGSGISNLTFSTTKGATAEGWNTGALGSSDYYQVTLTAKTGSAFVIEKISFDQISNTSTTNMKFDVNWSDDNFASSNKSIVIGSSSTTTSASSSTTTEININAGETITFRIFGYNADGAELFSVKNLKIEGTREPSEILSCDSTGNSGELDVKKIKFSNKGMKYNTFGSDDEWFPYEEIEVQIEVKNGGDDDVDDVEISWGIWNTKTNEWVIDIDEEDTVDIKDGDTEKLTFTFVIDDDVDVDLEDLSDGENYRFYVTAEGTVDNDDSDDTCVSDFETASVIVESDFVVLDDVTIPETVQCNALVEVTVDVLNVGDRDQDDVYLEVVDLGGVLKIKESLLVGDVNAFDKERVSFTTRIPSDATEGTYSLVFSVLDEDKDIYENDFDDEQSKYTLPIKVQGNCGTSATILGTASVSATLESGGEAGKDLVVNAIITNKGTSSATFLISSSGYGAWADSATVEPGTLTLNAGESGSVSITLGVKDSASGTNTFDIEVVSGNQVATTQKVSVPITEKKGFFTGSVIGGSDNNYLLWGVGLLNVILIVAIIIVVVRIFRK